MTEHDRPAFYAMMTGLFEVYGKRGSAELLGIYFGALKGYELADLSRAANLHALDPDQGQFMPKPADFVRHIDGSKETRSMRAWSLVERTIRQVGQYASVVFDDPVIHRVIEDMGGWIDLCGTATEKDLEFRAIEFGKRYQGYALQGGVTEWQPVLIGLEEADCARHQINGPSPRLIGNPEIAAKVMLEGRKTERRLSHSASDFVGNFALLLEAKDSQK